MNRDESIARMRELMKPLNRQILMCDTRDDLLMLASCFLVTAKDILDQQIGPNGRKLMFDDFA
jgi:hypothetical protein